MPSTQASAFVTVFRFVVSALVTITAGTSLHAQPRPAGEPSAILGGWTINRDLSATGPSLDGRAGDRGRGEADPGGRSGGGRFGGRGGGRGGSGGGGFGGGRGGGRGMDREEMEKTRALMQDFMTPTVRWVIVAGDGDVVVFTDADGRTTRYAVNDKKEKHQLRTGTIETKTKWVGSELHQEIALREGVKATRTFAIEEEQLAVTTTIDGAGRGRRRPPVLWVYDRDVLRQ